MGRKARGPPRKAIGYFEDLVVEGDEGDIVPELEPPVVDPEVEPAPEPLDEPEPMPELEAGLDGELEPEALLLWPWSHSARLIWPSWFLSSLSNSLELDDLLLEPPAAEPSCDEEPVVPEDEELPLLLCDIDGELEPLVLDLLLVSLAAANPAKARSEKPTISAFNCIV